MSHQPAYYRICSCGAHVSPRCQDTMKKHRDMGHTIPMRKYSGITGEPLPGMGVYNPGSRILNRTRT